MNTITPVRSDKNWQKREKSEELREVAQQVLSAQNAEMKDAKQPKTNLTFEVLTDKLRSLTWSIIHRTCKYATQEDKDDLYQNINIKLFNKLAGYDGRRCFINWYATLCQRTCIDGGRKVSRYRQVIVPYHTTLTCDEEDFDIRNLYPSRAIGPAEDCDYHLMQEIVAKSTSDFLRTYPREADVVRLKMVHMPNKQIATMTGRTFGQVKGVVLRWRRLLRQRFAEVDLVKGKRYR